MRTIFARQGFATTIATIAAVGVAVLAATTMWSRAHSATITASYESGYLDVSINGYGTSGMGTFRLNDSGAGHVALCVEANEHHSTEADAYSPVDNRIASPELDALIWLLSRMPSVDADTGIAAAALAWYFSDARRNIGVPVWADGHNGFTPISPVVPERWDSLAPYSLSHLVGLRAEGVELDQAERRVVELYDAAKQLVGPWAITGSEGRFRLTGPSGPISGQTINVEIRDHTGSTTSSIDLVTDTDGLVTPAVPAMSSGGSLVATATSPGVHREWDGEGDVQRLVTATDVTVTADWSVPAEPGHLLVVKRSTDPTIGVGGAVFALLDGNGAEIERFITGTDGEARFAPVDPSNHGGPYTLHEVSAPPGLLITAPDQTVPTLSWHADAPTVLVMTDAPRTIPVLVHKRLSIDGTGPPDRSGFEFDVTRLSDGLTTRLVTGADGVSQPVELAVGDYTVCERAVPDWATLLVDGGCVAIAVTVDLVDEYDEAISVDPTQRPAFPVVYTNDVVAPVIRTSAHDPIDGDRLLGAAGGRAIDVVTLDGLIPGTLYVITGELVPPGGLPSDVGVEEGEPVTPRDGALRATAYVEFTAVSASETHDVEFDIPALPAGRYVIVERLWVGDQLVAEHADLTDELQTIEIAAPTSTSTTTSSTTTTTTPPPVVATTTSSTTATTSTTTSTTTTAATTPPTTTPPASTDAPSTTTRLPTPPTLPRTGSASARQLLRVGDFVLLIGVVLIAATRLVPRRDPHTQHPGSQHPGSQHPRR
ncbi:MAG TPA: SpaA isopeptide-forming pilin-related protein [Ilumatobacter sp.]|nr:SpaA isopeptide-forming pilin-related protein [Ilumatobacter sp.]